MFHAVLIPIVPQSIAFLPADNGPLTLNLGLFNLIRVYLAQRTVSLFALLISARYHPRLVTNLAFRRSPRAILVLSVIFCKSTVWKRFTLGHSRVRRSPQQCSLPSLS